MQNRNMIGQKIYLNSLFEQNILYASVIITLSQGGLHKSMPKHPKKKEKKKEEMHNNQSYINWQVIVI